MTPDDRAAATARVNRPATEWLALVEGIEEPGLRAQMAGTVWWSYMSGAYCNGQTPAALAPDPTEATAREAVWDLAIERCRVPDPEPQAVEDALVRLGWTRAQAKERNAQYVSALDRERRMAALKAKWDRDWVARWSKGGGWRRLAAIAAREARG